jgi:hypothetical protein
MLEAEYKYFKEHKAQLLAKYPGRFIVIKGEIVLGDFATQNEALKFALIGNSPGTFMIQECTEKADQIMRFHSRVTFPDNAQA